LRLYFTRSTLCCIDLHISALLLSTSCHLFFFFFFFNDTATTEIYTLSLHDALPIFPPELGGFDCDPPTPRVCSLELPRIVCSWLDRKSTRLNSSHVSISYAVFCLKKKKNLHLPKSLTSRTPHIIRLPYYARPTTKSL